MVFDIFGKKLARRIEPFFDTPKFHELKNYGDFCPIRWQFDKKWRKIMTKTCQKMTKSCQKIVTIHFSKIVTFSLFDSFLAFFQQSYVSLRVWPRVPNSFLEGRLESKLAKTMKNAWKNHFYAFLTKMRARQNPYWKVVSKKCQDRENVWKMTKNCKKVSKSDLAKTGKSAKKAF